MVNTQRVQSVLKAEGCWKGPLFTYPHLRKE